MSFKIALIFICAFAVTACASVGGRYKEAVKRGNDYVDRVLRDIREEYAGEYDPYNLPDKVIAVNKKVLFVNITGEAKLHKGVVKGLRHLHRADECRLIDRGEKLEIEADLAAGVLEMKYDGTVKFMNYGPTIVVHGEVPFVEIVMVITVNANTGREGKIRKFVIKDVRAMQVWITGLGPLNWAANTLIKAVNIIFQRFVRSILESRIQKHLSDKVANYQFPVEGGLTTPVIEITTPTDTETDEVKSSDSTTSSATESQTTPVLEFTTTTSPTTEIETTPILEVTTPTSTETEEITITSEVTTSTLAETETTPAQEETTPTNAETEEATTISDVTSTLAETESTPVQEETTPTNGGTKEASTTSEVVTSTLAETDTTPVQEETTTNAGTKETITTSEMTTSTLAETETTPTNAATDEATISEVISSTFAETETTPVLEVTTVVDPETDENITVTDTPATLEVTTLTSSETENTDETENVSSSTNSDDESSDYSDHIRFSISTDVTSTSAENE